MTLPYGVISDPHYHRWDAFATTNADGLNSRLEIQLDATKEAAKAMKAAGCKHMLVAGDTFHVRGAIPNGFYPAGIDDVLKLPAPVWVIGGGQIYSLFLPYVEEIWLSHIGVDVPCADAFFPAPMMRSLGFVPVETAYTQRANEDEPGFLQIVYRRS